MLALLSVWVTLGITAITTTIWAVRLEGRVNTLYELIIERDKQYTERQVDIKSRLMRIEEKLDNVTVSAAVATATVASAAAQAAAEVLATAAKILKP